tara:strand:- start:38 stop:208 length:171 start_codon:yes stop_codon:yes gene_type:complete
MSREFSSVVSVQFYGNNFEAENEAEYIAKVKTLFAEQYNINLSDDEIGEIEEMPNE